MKWLVIICAVLLVAVVTDCSMGSWSKTERGVITTMTYNPPSMFYTVDDDGHMIEHEIPKSYVLYIVALTFTVDKEVTQDYYESHHVRDEVYVRQRIGKWLSVPYYTQIVPSPEVPVNN